MTLNRSLNAVLGLSLATTFLSSQASAQIVPDSTLPINSIVTSEGSTVFIDGGTEAGSNLFHSFQDFSIPENSTAFFNNSLNIGNIFSRITGGSISDINGSLQANGTANLFLINPNGIVFGKNAQLNLGGSFFATTADSIEFADGFEFSAIEPQSSPLLTVNVPVGLQFGEIPGEIEVRGQGHNLTVDDVGLVIDRDRPNGLSIEAGNTLALVGGELILDGGNLTAVSGRIELGSVSGSSVIPSPIQIVSAGNGFMLGYDGVSTYGDIQFINAASADVSGNGGVIQVQGRQVSLHDGSAIFAITEDTQEGGNLRVRAADSLEIIGNTATPNDSLFRSSLLSQAQGSGKAGDLLIETTQLLIKGGEAAASTFSEGDAGNLTVVASDRIEIKGVETDGALTSGLFSIVNPDATGNGGNLTIETRHLTVHDGAQVSTSTFGNGKGGNLSIRASESIEVVGVIVDGQISSGLFSQTWGQEDGGNLSIETGSLIVRDGALISNDTFSSGNAGSLLTKASELVEVSGGYETSDLLFYPSEISTQVNFLEGDEGENFPATGSGGNLIIETQEVLVQDGGLISATTTSEGASGNLTVSASNFVELVGIAPNGYPSGLFATTEGSGVGGNLIVNTSRLIARDGAQVAASTLGSGEGGTVTINALESVELSGLGRLADGEVALTDERDILRSGLFARTRLNGSGRAGSVNVNTGELIVRDGATTTVSSYLGSENAGAGNLTVNADDIRIDNGIMTAETRFGDFGNINLRSRAIQLRNNSSITTSANSLGGNVIIDTDVLAALENSDITANSTDDRGGQVNITTQGLFRQGYLGTEAFRESSDFTSDITATSNLGPQFDGIVEINTPDIDPTRGLVALPTAFEPTPINDPCANPQQDYGFVNTGRGGLPPNPREALNLGIGTVEQRNAAELPETRVLVEAQGWIVGAKGEIILVADAPTFTPSSSWQPTMGCSLDRS